MMIDEMLLLSAIALVILALLLRSGILLILAAAIIVGYPLMNGTTDILGYWSGVMTKIAVEGVLNNIKNWFGSIWNTITGWLPGGGLVV